MGCKLDFLSYPYLFHFKATRSGYTLRFMHLVKKKNSILIFQVRNFLILVDLIHASLTIRVSFFLSQLTNILYFFSTFRVILHVAKIDLNIEIVVLKLDSDSTNSWSQVENLRKSKTKEYNILTQQVRKLKCYVEASRGHSLITPKLNNHRGSAGL